jgi:hypothetical protein
MADPAMGEPRQRLYRMRYEEGPMGFLSDQIRKMMQRVGYPTREFQLYRTPEQQRQYLKARTTKAPPWFSAHQYYGAADIIHEQWAWFAADQAPDGRRFWETLWDCVEVVAEKFDVEFSKRLEWDPAHIELANWRQMKEVVGESQANQMQLDWYFAVTLPKVWRQHQRQKT